MTDPDFSHLLATGRYDAAKAPPLEAIVRRHQRRRARRAATGGLVAAVALAGTGVGLGLGLSSKANAPIVTALPASPRAPARPPAGLREFTSTAPKGVPPRASLGPSAAGQAATGTARHATSAMAQSLCTRNGCTGGNRLRSRLLLKQHVGRLEVIVTIEAAPLRGGVWFPLAELGWQVAGERAHRAPGGALGEPARAPSSTGQPRAALCTVSLPAASPSLCGPAQDLVVAVYSTGAHPTLMGTATVPAGGPSSHPIEVLAALELGAVPSRVGIVVVRSRPEVASVRATWQGGASAASSPLAHAQRWSVLVRPVGKGTRAPGVGSRVRVVAFSSSGRALETTVVNAVGVLYLAPVACPAS